MVQDNARRAMAAGIIDKQNILVVHVAVLEDVQHVEVTAYLVTKKVKWRYMKTASMPIAI